MMADIPSIGGAENPATLGQCLYSIRAVTYSSRTVTVIFLETNLQLPWLLFNVSENLDINFNYTVILQ